MKVNLKSLSEKELFEFIEKQGQSSYRARQIINWIYKKSATSFEDMTDLSKSFRELLNKIAFLSNLKLISRIIGKKDGTQKFLFELEDKETIESVLIPDKNRLTLCISSQAGCAMGCKFCATGKIGLRRNLKAFEIVDQIISVSRIIAQEPIIHPYPPLVTPLVRGDTEGLIRGREDSKITNIVFMGMGEPLHNFNEVIESLWRITTILGFSGRRITVSTCGIVPKIYELAQRAPKTNLAISLNATTDAIRNRIMPINKKYPLSELLSACRKFPLAPRRRITFEYVLFEGINDLKEDALRLIYLLKGIKSKVNLIPYNPSSIKDEFRTTPEAALIEFQKILQNAGITAIIRKSKGADISAACGQLRATYFLRNASTIFKSS